MSSRFVSGFDGRRKICTITLALIMQAILELKLRGLLTTHDTRFFFHIGRYYRTGSHYVLVCKLESIGLIFLISGIYLFCCVFISYDGIVMIDPWAIARDLPHSWKGDVRQPLFTFSLGSGDDVDLFGFYFTSIVQNVECAVVRFLARLVRCVNFGRIETNSMLIF